MHNPSPRRVANADRILTYIGRVVKTTDGRCGKVASATVEGSSIVLHIREDGNSFDTDVEHATIVREDDG